MAERRIMSQIEIIRANDLLREHLVLIDGEKKLYEFKVPWDDEKIALAVAKDLHGGHVKYLREKMYGKLKSQNNDLLSMQSELKLLRAEHYELQVRFNTLCDNLSVNRVIDTRHLKVKHA